MRCGACVHVAWVVVVAVGLKTNSKAITAAVTK